MSDDLKEMVSKLRAQDDPLVTFAALAYLCIPVVLIIAAVACVLSGHEGAAMFFGFLFAMMIL